MKKILTLFLALALILGTFCFPISAGAVNTTNPVIKGSFADPDIDAFGCKYWIYPTTDGNPGWSGTQFHAFSSENLVDWEDEGVILDVADDNPSLNENGVQIASSKWSAGNAWAPTIEEYNGKYYFYYCARIKEELLDTYAVKNDDQNYNDKAIGVAVSDSPSGPFTALDTPIVYPKLINNLAGQVIDPSIFIDDDGKKYMFFGNGTPYRITLGDDMLSVDSSSIKVLSGLRDFRESVVVFKRNGIYHYTWSCDDTGSTNYHINYGTSTSFATGVYFRGTIVEKDEDNSIFGTGHQSILYLKDSDKCYIAYGRHQTENGVSVNDAGNFREVCINELSFNAAGYLTAITPTNTAVSPLSLHEFKLSKTTVTAANFNSNGNIEREYTCTICSDKYSTKTAINKIASVSISQTKYTFNNTAKKPAVTVKDSAGKVIPSSNYTVIYTNNKNVGKASVKVAFKGDFIGQKTLNFTINPKNTSISKLTAGKKSFTVKIKKYTTQTDGYQMQYSTDKNFKTGVKTVTLNNKTTSKTVKSLKAKKKYYVRIRTYKTSNKVKYYSSWSNVKNITTKK